MRNGSFLPLVLVGLCVSCLRFAAQPLVAQEAEVAQPQEEPADTTLTLAEIRSKALRAQRLERFGGTEASEAAVELALKWIVSRQADDGGWNFNHNLPGKEVCPNPGMTDYARNAATAMALLPLLGSGSSHKDGPYQKQVQRGIDYLKKHAKVAETGSWSWHESGGAMHAHGLATLAMCDAFELTHDMDLLEAVQSAVKYTEESQDPAGGGWRYFPKQAGDTSITGWQLLALHNARRAGVKVKDETFARGMKYLDGAQANGGATYGYVGPGEGLATSAQGLLCRMRGGWKRGHEGLQSGIERLDKTSPKAGIAYYNFFATEVMFQAGGTPWQRWNERLRDSLVKSQESDEGPAQGTWFFQTGDQGNSYGGRLYHTSLATLMLQAYYRQPGMLAAEAR